MSIALTNLEAAKTITYKVAHENTGVYIMVIEGAIKIGETHLNKRDAIGVYATENVEITSYENAELIAIEVPMSF